MNPAEFLFVKSCIMQLLLSWSVNLKIQW